MLPFLKLPFGVEISSYLVMFFLAVLVFTYFWIKEIYSSQLIPVLEAVWLAVFTLLGALFGARIFFYIGKFYSPVDSGYLGQGLCFLGGLMPVVLILAGYGFRKKIKFRDLLDSLVFPLLLAHIVGRVGCFLAGCCFGKESFAPWALNFEGISHLRHPTQVYEIILLLVMLLCLKLNSFRLPLRSYRIYFLLYFVGRFVIEFYRGDQIRGRFFDLLSTSQFLCLVFFVLWLLLDFWAYADHKGAYEKSGRKRSRPVR